MQSTFLICEIGNALVSTLIAGGTLAARCHNALLRANLAFPESQLLKDRMQIILF